MIGRRKYKREIFLITVFCIAYTVFTWYLIPECMHQAWFNHVGLLQKWFERTLTWSDMACAFGEHGMLGYNFLLLLNTELFNLNTRFDGIINDFCVLGFGILAIYHLRMSSQEKRGLLYWVTALAICLACFGFHQVSGGSMETQVRIGILFSALIAHMADRCLTGMCGKKDLTILVLVMVVGVNFFGTLYSFALYPVLFVYALVQMVRAHKILPAQTAICITAVATTILYLVEYSILNNDSISGGMVSTIIQILKNPILLLKTLVVYNAAGLLGYATYVDILIPRVLYLFIGVLVTGAICLTLFLFFRTKMYKKTIFPLLLIGYSFIVWGMVLLGRFKYLDGDPGWFCNFWYVCHMKMQIVGTLLIFFRYFHERKKVLQLAKTEIFQKKISGCSIAMPILSVICIVALGCGLVVGNAAALRRAPAEHEWYMDKQMWLFADEEDEMPEDENGLTPLLYNKGKALAFIQLMKEHSLGVYRYYGSYMKLMETVGKDENGNYLGVQYLNGHFSDGWLEKESRYQIRSGKEGILHIELYQPDETRQSMAGVLVIDEERYAFNLAGESTVLEYSVKPNSVLDIAILMDDVVINKGADLRELSVVLSDIQCS